MKMGRVLLTTFFLLHLVLVPSKAFPFRSWNIPFGLQDNGIGLENPEASYHPLFQQELPDAGLKQPGEEEPEDKTKPLKGYEPLNPDKEEPEGKKKEKNPDKEEPEGKKKEKNPDKEEPEGKKKEKNPGDGVITAAPKIGNLKQGFYSQSCPKAEKIVADWLAETAKTNPNAISNLLRLQFHDCFVGGCDASVLLDYVGGENVEKSSLFNGILLKGADLIDDLKAKLEQECPETVSCADAMAFAANEALALAGLPHQRPLGGRRDATTSLAANAENNNLPLPNWSLDQMIELFQKKGFSQEEMVILTGAHSVGSAHCDIFMERIYNFQNTQKPDPAMPVPIVDELKQICVNPGTPQFRNPPVNFDETPTKLDNLFFKNMVDKKKSLLITDSHFIDDPRTAPVVQQMAADPKLFQKRISELMVKLFTLNVLTGNEGEIRKTCRASN